MTLSKRQENNKAQLYVEKMTAELSYNSHCSSDAKYPIGHEVCSILYNTMIKTEKYYNELFVTDDTRMQSVPNDNEHFASAIETIVPNIIVETAENNGVSECYSLNDEINNSHTLLYTGVAIIAPLSAIVGVSYCWLAYTINHACEIMP